MAGMIARAGADPAAQLYDASVVQQIAFRRDEAMRLQDTAVAASPLIRIRNNRSRPDALRLLALVLPGDLMANTPLDFITSHLNVRLDLLFMVPGQPLPAIVPDHDVMFFAGSDPDPATLARMRALFASWPRPVLNDPGLQPFLARDRLARLLADLPGVCSPPAIEVGHERLDAMLHPNCTQLGGGIGGLLPCGYPVLIRPCGSHAGKGLARIDDAAALSAYLLSSPAPSYYLTAFMDYRSADGLYRKYRVAFIDREPHLCHMAASEHWMVHYLNAGMTEDAGKRAEEARAMAQFRSGFAARHADAFDALHERLPFDYYSLDCAELPDGRLLVFEADTAAIIHLMDAADMFPYKHAHMPGVFDAFFRMLRRRRP